jgi:hypothetical protein
MKYKRMSTCDDCGVPSASPSKWNWLRRLLNLTVNHGYKKKFKIVTRD